jgi:hypothetical protein
MADEGAPFTLDASASRDPEQSTESLTYEWDFSYDGIAFVPEAAGIQVPQTISNNLAESVTYAVRVTDAGGLSDIATTTVAVVNVPPNLDDLLGLPRLNVEIDAQYVATLTGDFADPGSDAHTVLIDWDDGSQPTALDVPFESRSFLATHQYAAPAESNQYEIIATVTDQDDASDSGSVVLVVAEPTASLHGRKFNDENANGVFDAGEAALAGSTWYSQRRQTRRGTIVLQMLRWARTWCVRCNSLAGGRPTRSILCSEPAQAARANSRTDTAIRWPCRATVDSWRSRLLRTTWLQMTTTAGGMSSSRTRLRGLSNEPRSRWTAAKPTARATSRRSAPTAT